MVQYNLSGNIDPNKVFLINRSELEGRFDPYFFKGEFSLLRKHLESKGFVKFGYLIKSWNRGDGPRDGYYTENKLTGVPFLRINNLKNNTVDLSDVKFINRIIHETKLKRTKVKSGNLIFAISGTKDNLGTVSIIPENIKEANLNSALVRLDIDAEKISNEFVCLLFDLKITRTQIEFIGKGAAQNNLNNKEISSILVPNISIEEQLFFVKMLREAKIETKRKESEAKALLESIDSYLLEELGITLPEKTEVKTEDIPTWMNPENQLVKNGRLFLTSSREVIGQRLDPDYTLKIGFLNALQSKYPFIHMKDIMDRPPQYGANEESIDGNPDTDIRYIRITDIDELGNLRPDTFKTATTIDNQYLLSENDLLFARSGATAGKCYIHKGSEKSSIFAGYLIRFRLNTDIALPDYVFHFCNSKLYAYWVSMIQRPSAQPNINSEEFKSLLIPLPPFEKQSQIANYITSTRQRAFELQKEALNLLELTKREIEIMILGE